MSANSDVGGSDRVERRPLVDVTFGDVVYVSHRPTLTDADAVKLAVFRSTVSESRATSVVPLGQDRCRERVTPYSAACGAALELVARLSAPGLDLGLQLPL